MYFFLWMFAFTSIVSCVPQYYWKDFYGVIPEDAFEGGIDGGGNPTYIGQTYFPEKKSVFPTIIERGNKYAYVGVFNKKLESDLHTKILCSKRNDLFRWVQTNTTTMDSITGCRKIYGGAAAGHPVAIGRANHLGRTLTGRVVNDPVHKWYGLWIHDLKFQDFHIDDFEILTFNCYNPWSVETFDK